MHRRGHRRGRDPGLRRRSGPRGSPHRGLGGAGRRRIGLRLAASGLGPGADVTRPEGAAQIDRLVMTLELVRFFRPGRTVQPMLAVGAGWQDVRVHGTSAMPSLASAHEGQVFSGARLRQRRPGLRAGHAALRHRRGRDAALSPAGDGSGRLLRGRPSRRRRAVRPRRVACEILVSSRASPSSRRLALALVGAGCSGRTIVAVDPYPCSDGRRDRLRDRPAGRSDRLLASRRRARQRHGPRLVRVGQRRHPRRYRSVDGLGRGRSGGRRAVRAGEGLRQRGGIGFDRFDHRPGDGRGLDLPPGHITRLRDGHFPPDRNRLRPALPPFGQRSAASHPLHHHPDRGRCSSEAR